MFVLRSNVESAPIAALKTYRMRGTVENDFEQFKNWLDGDRLRCTEKTILESSLSARWQRLCVS